MSRTAVRRRATCQDEQARPSREHHVTPTREHTLLPRSAATCAGSLTFKRIVAELGALKLLCWGYMYGIRRVRQRPQMILVLNSEHKGRT